MRRVDSRPPPKPRRQPQQAVILPSNQPPEDRDAFIAWLDRQYGGFIKKELARRNDLSWESQRDLHQTVLLICWKYHGKEVEQGKQGSPEHIPAFLHTVIGNATANHGRHKDRRPALEGDLPMHREPDRAPNPEEAAMLSEMQEQAAQYGAELTPLEARILEARDLDGITFEVIAAALGIPKTNVFRIHESAKAKLERRAQAPERDTTPRGTARRAMGGDPRVKKAVPGGRGRF